MVDMAHVATLSLVFVPSVFFLLLVGHRLSTLFILVVILILLLLGRVDGACEARCGGVPQLGMGGAVFLGLGASSFPFLGLGSGLGIDTIRFLNIPIKEG